jgi:hypothetical protein
MNEYIVTAPNGQEFNIYAYSSIEAITWYAGANYGFGWKAIKQ